MSAIARDPQASESDLQVETVADASLERENVDVTVEGRSTWSKRPTDDCDDVACCICVPNSLLQSWWLERTHDTSYIQLVNDNVRGKIITLDSNCERLERRLYRPREALNIIRITPRSSALYNAILYGKIVLAQYRTQGFSTLMRVVGIFRHKQRLCALLCSFMQCSISKIRQ